jgi:hypothetical protein
MIGLVLCLLNANAVRATSLGPGNVATTNQDGSFDMIVIDLTTPAVLAPGSYTATLFNYEFLQTLATTGIITPLLATGGGSSFTPIAIGDSVPFTGGTGFISTPFGGTNSFTLAASTTVFAGFFWDANVAGDLMPIGFLSLASGNLAFIRYAAAGGGQSAGADPPIIGTPISGGAGDPRSSHLRFQYQCAGRS